jgi:hypothetical protein
MFPDYVSSPVLLPSNHCSPFACCDIRENISQRNATKAECTLIYELIWRPTHMPLIDLNGNSV